ncbi:radical SAM family heme chaperone HemW [Peptacetobacter sp.]|uniref:radical SAM family heme chaperone HemW n=1 Tax=Peptacetobacter sp. TaxID=2991975 RepID=UPI0026028D25|nr:radical SAM family heme chaperone HemW [Peptacetobacter sp.]
MFGIYIHIPFCVKKCKYCDFNSFNMNLNEKKIYLEDLKKEIEMYSSDYKNKKIDTIFFGGGTPSILTSKEIEDLMRILKEKFDFSKEVEITMECNPGTIDREKLQTMKINGINRLSIGLQAVQNSHLKYIGRIHTYEEFEKNFKEARTIGFDNINIDLMFDLPNQTEDDWKESLKKVVKLNPEHISAYSLILEEGTELFEMYNREEFSLMDENKDMDMYEYTINYLRENGYNQYEISNYAKKDKECKHNIIYWKCENYIGLGAGASGYLGKERYTNEMNLSDYHKKTYNNQKPIMSIEMLSEEEMIEEKVFMNLRMNEGINRKEFKEKFGIDFYEKYKNKIDTLKERNLLTIDDISIKLTQKGREISNNVFLEILS